MFTQKEISRTLYKVAGGILAIASFGLMTQTVNAASGYSDTSSSSQSSGASTSAPSQADLSAAFSEMDTNRDGVVSREEYQSYYSKHYGSTSSSQSGMSSEPSQLQQQGDRASDGSQPRETPPLSRGDGGGK